MFDKNIGTDRTRKVPASPVSDSYPHSTISRTDLHMFSNFYLIQRRSTTSAPGVFPKNLIFVQNSWDRFVVPGVFPENHKTPRTDLVPAVWSQEVYRHQFRLTFF